MKSATCAVIHTCGNFGNVFQYFTKHNRVVSAVHSGIISGLNPRVLKLPGRTGQHSRSGSPYAFLFSLLGPLRDIVGDFACEADSVAYGGLR